MDENNNNNQKKDKVSRMDEYTSQSNVSKDNEDLELFRRNKKLRNRKRRRYDSKTENDDIETQSSFSNNEEHQIKYSFEIEGKRETKDNLTEENNISTNTNQHYDNLSLDTGNMSQKNQEMNVEQEQNGKPFEENTSESNKTENKESSNESSTKQEQDKKKHLFNKLTFSKNKQHGPLDNDKKSESNGKVTEIKPLTLEEKRALRRKRQKRIQYTIITLLILMIVIFLLYMFTPLSKIANVNINGNNNVSTSKINKELNVTSHSRMYTFSKNKAINNLKKNPLIKDVEIHKQLPNTLNVKVIEYQIVGLEKNKDKYVPIIEDGKELKDYSDDVSHDGPILDGFKGKKKERMIQALSEMSPKVRSMIAEISYAPEKNKQSRIEIFTKDNLQVIGDITTIANKMQYYPQMSQSLSRDDSGNLKTEGYIDLSVGASFIPYKVSSNVESDSSQDVTKSTQEENQAKEELQNVLNKINKQSNENN